MESSVDRLRVEVHPSKPALGAAAAALAPARVAAGAGRGMAATGAPDCAGEYAIGRPRPDR